MRSHVTDCSVCAMVRTHTDLIKSLGGASAVAKAINARPATVRMWKLRKRIPRSSWPEVIEAFPAITMDSLKAAEGASE